MTLSDVELDLLVDQQKVLNFCLDQLISANDAKVSEAKKEPYEIIALVAIDNIVKLITASNEKQ